eukprot:TRINITY_DN9156_c0_g1_i1.p1 TRINITY_DN9156_c0_g1~~TRINITY_DN9156_c0_g1_i1.p1  ORF type:complete len:122 (-),score=26.10 TRINITY_DN9156_c0_g1_i1:103-468(-)
MKSLQATMLGHPASYDLTVLMGKVQEMFIFDHLVGVFATADNGAIFRLDVKAASDNIDTTAITARLKVTNGDGTTCTGNVQYGTEYALFSEDGTKRLDIGTQGAGTPTAWDMANSNTRLHV